MALITYLIVNVYILLLFILVQVKVHKYIFVHRYIGIVVYLTTYPMIRCDKLISSVGVGNLNCYFLMFGLQKQ